MLKTAPTDYESPYSSKPSPNGWNAVRAASAVLIAAALFAFVDFRFGRLLERRPDGASKHDLALAGLFIAAAALGYVARASIAGLLRLARTRSARIVLASATAAAGGFWLAPLFAGPVAGRLPAAPLLSYALAAAIVGGAVVLCMAATAKPREVGFFCVFLAVAAVWADAAVLHGGYDLFHCVLGAAAVLLMTEGSLRFGTENFRLTQTGGGLLASVVLGALGFVVACSILRGDAGASSEVARRSTFVWRLAAACATDEAPADEADLDPAEPALRALDEAEHAAAVADAKNDVPRAVLFVTVDALRADYGPGSARGAELMPRISRWSDGGRLFTRAYTSAVASWPSFRSILTGFYPSAFADGAQPVNETFLGAMRRAGYRTSLMAGLPVLGPDDARWLPSLAHEIEVLKLTATTPGCVAEASKLVDGPEKRFLWIHLGEMHMPYRPPERLVVGGGPRALYEACARHVDELIAPLLESLPDDVLVVLSADHGEDFPFEHGLVGHGFGLYEGALRVPLVVRGPGVRPGRCDEPVSLVDLAPTFRGLVGESSPGMSDGLSLLAEVRGREALALRRRAAVFASRIHDYLGAPVRNPERAMIGRRLKITIGRFPARAALFDLDEDPGERENLYSSEPEIAASVRAQMARALRTRAARAASAPGAKSQTFMIDRRDADRALEDARSADAGRRADGARRLAIEPDPEHKALLESLAKDESPSVRAWAAVGLGSLAKPGEAWPAAEAILGPEEAAGRAVLDLLLEKPQQDAAEALIWSARQADDLHRWHAAAALALLGHEVAHERLRAAILHPVPDIQGVHHLLACISLRPRPETPSHIEMVRRRFDDPATAAAVVVAATKMPGSVAGRILAEFAASADPLVRVEAEAAVRSHKRAEAEALARLKAGRADEDWTAGPFHAAWGLLPGIDFTRPPQDALVESEWRPTDPRLPARAAAGPQFLVAAAVPPGARVLEVAFVAGAGGRFFLDVDGEERGPFPLSPGPHRVRTPLPEAAMKAGRTEIRARVEADDLTLVGWREILLLAESP